MTKTSTTNEGSHHHVPHFSGEREAAAFWDTHSPFDFPGEFEEVAIGPARAVRKRVRAALGGIEDIEGIGPSYAAKLKEMGISTVEKLLERGASRGGRQEIASTTGIRDDLVLRWVNHADLYRIKGVGAELAELLEAAGVDSVPELAQRDPENLQKVMAAKNEEEKLTRRVPSKSQVTAWVAEAKTLEWKVSH
jgi:predicted flap endonuclease-1-like 5' DNA nuclease